MGDRTALLEISPFEIDQGQLIGRRPQDVPSEILRLNFRGTNPTKAIRAKCLDCSGGDASEVRKCVASGCALWPFRLGTNPFRKRAELSDAEKQRRAERLRAAAPHAVVSE